MKNHIKIFLFITFHKNLIGPKPLHIRFDEIDGHIGIYDGTIYLVLLVPEN